jgi:hypothetical protein
VHEVEEVEQEAMRLATSAERLLKRIVVAPADVVAATGALLLVVDDVTADRSRLKSTPFPGPVMNQAVASLSGKLWQRVAIRRGTVTPQRPEPPCATVEVET